MFYGPEGLDGVARPGLSVCLHDEQAAVGALHPRAAILGLEPERVVSPLLVEQVVFVHLHRAVGGAVAHGISLTMKISTFQLNPSGSSTFKMTVWQLVQILRMGEADAH